MQPLFDPLKKLVVPEKVAIDNGVFRLHYKATVIILVLSSIMLTAKQYFGDPIECFVQGVPAGIVDTYCWVHGTYTMRRFDPVNDRSPTDAESHYYQKMGHSGYSHKGIETPNPNVNERVYHVFYQWVGFLIFIQAILFYAPRHLWKIIEDGRMKFCSQDSKSIVLDGKSRGDQVERLNKVYKKYQGRNQTYAYKFFFCEILNLVNVVGQIFLTNRFLGGKFLDYGSRIYWYNQNTHGHVDPMNDVFPKVAKCQFNRHGPGGDINNHDALCLLPLNIVNEKIYLIMWIWLIFVAFWSALAVLYRFLCMCSTSFRTFILSRTSGKWSYAASACKGGQYGDWFMLRQLSKNVDEEVFSHFLKNLGDNIDPWETKIGKKRSIAYNIPTLPSLWNNPLKSSNLYPENNSHKALDSEDSDSFTMSAPPMDKLA